MSPEADDIKTEVIEAQKGLIQLDISEKFQKNAKPSGPTYWWGEDDNHDGSEWAGVQGRITFTNVSTTAIDEDVKLNADAKLLKIALPDMGSLKVRKVLSGSASWEVFTARWDTLKIEFSGGGPQIGILGPEGSISLNFMADWIWDANTTKSDHLLTINPEGSGQWQVNWSGEPDDNSLLPSFEDDYGTHKNWERQEEFGGGLVGAGMQQLYNATKGSPPGVKP